MNQLRKKLLEYLTPQPEIKNDYVEKVVYLLRRDFNTQEQNDIIIAIGKRICEEREKDMSRMSDEYADINEGLNELRNKFS